MDASKGSISKKDCLSSLSVHKSMSKKNIINTGDCPNWIANRGFQQLRATKPGSDVHNE